MPRIIYGTAWKRDKTADCVRRALSLGFRGLDTACQPKHYNEAGVGDGIAAFLESASGAVTRADLYIQTKFTPLSGQDPQQVPYDPKAPIAEQVEQSLQVSLRNLRTDYLDCLVLHSPLPDYESMNAVWQTMESFVDQGRVRQIGLSNSYRHHYFQNFHRAVRIKPAVLQNRFEPTYGYYRDWREFCREHGVVYQTFWTLTANAQLLASATVQRLAAKHRRTAPQILFRYLTHEGIVPLTGTQSERHMRDDLEIFEFELTDEDRQAITKLL